jgi:hypothetical protein
MLRSSQNTYFEPNIGKFKVIIDLLADIAPYLTKKANEYISMARKEMRLKRIQKKNFIAICRSAVR